MRWRRGIAGAYWAVLTRLALDDALTDCVSHEAAWAVKRLCRAAGRPYRPLRSSGVTSFLAALAGGVRPASIEG
ncbi:MAG: hypothetical protein JWR00_1093 [Rubritepida sp.]|nr:hypothetical protein [Rubritepida sp.]